MEAAELGGADHDYAQVSAVFCIEGVAVGLFVVPVGGFEFAVGE